MPTAYRDFIITPNRANTTSNALLDMRGASASVNTSMTTEVRYFGTIQRSVHVVNSSMTVTSANTFYVVPGMNTFSDAAAAMNDGDCIVLGPGTYSQNVAVMIPTTVQRFTIRGAGSDKTHIYYTEDVHGISSNVTAGVNTYRIQTAIIEGLTMFYVKSGVTNSQMSAIRLWGRNYDNLPNLLPTHGNNLNPNYTIYDVSIMRGPDPGGMTGGPASIDYCWGKAIHLIDCTNAHISNVFIRGSSSSRRHYGIYLEACTNCRIQNAFLQSLDTAYYFVTSSPTSLTGRRTYGSAWATATSYVIGNMVHVVTGLNTSAQDTNIYRALTNHTSSGTFASELGAGKWVLDDTLVGNGCEDISVSDSSTYMVNYGVVLGYRCLLCKFTNMDVQRPTLNSVLETITPDAGNGGYHHFSHCYFDYDTNQTQNQDVVKLLRPGSIVTGCVFEGNPADGAYKALVALNLGRGATGTRVTGNIFRGFGTVNGGFNGFGIYVDSDNCRIADNMFEDSKTGSGIDVYVVGGGTPATNNYISGNMIDTSLVDAGTSTKFGGVANVDANPVH